MKKIQSNWLKMFLIGALLILFYRITLNYEGSLDSIGNFIGVFTPCIIGIIIAFFLWRPTEKLEKLIGKAKWDFVRKIKKLLAIIVVYVLIIAIIALLVNFILPGLTKNIKDLATNAPTYIEKADKALKENKFLKDFDFIGAINEKVGGFIKENLTLNKINKYMSVIRNIAGSFMNFFLGFIFSIYILAEKEDIKSFWKKLGEKLFKGEKGNTFRKYGKSTVEMFYSYFAGLSIDAVIVGFITTIVLGIFKVPYAVLLGFLAAIGNMIPFFGPIVSSVTSFVITTLTLGPVNALWVLLIQIVLGQVDSNLIQPKILSKSTGISPLLVLLAVIVFGNMFGFFGMVLGVPIMATIKMVISDYFDNGTLDASNTEEQLKKGNDINE